MTEEYVPGYLISKKERQRIKETVTRGLNVNGPSDHKYLYNENNKRIIMLLNLSGLLEDIRFQKKDYSFSIKKIIVSQSSH